MAVPAFPTSSLSFRSVAEQCQGRGFLAEHTPATNGDDALGYTRGEQKVSSPPVDAFLWGNAHAEQPSPPRRLFPFASSITRIIGLAEDQLVGQQNQRNEHSRRKQQLGKLLHGIPPSTPLDSEGTARSLGFSIAY